ncbi:hypothetical protein AB0L13_25575 [Saccharopolyspora shandongensis]|uniref:hypothetical protein n=1 Tax=Saccharopolyspora shandongensis TaxID=418495 RepID=UPI0034298867
MNEIDDSQYSSSQTTTVSASKFVGASRATQIKLDSPGSADVVNFAIRRARKTRRVARDVRRLTGHGGIFDFRVDRLKVGVMPFLKFGYHGEIFPSKARVFWAQSFVPFSRWRRGSETCELILLGSLDNVVNESWLPPENELQIGHQYPSDPSVLCRIVQRELELADDEVKEDVDSIEMNEAFEEGVYAKFASRVTKDAQQPKGRSDSDALNWERPRPQMRKARIVGTVSDVADGIVLARPILVEDLT